MAVLSALPREAPRQQSHLSLYKTSDMMVLLLAFTVIFYLYDGYFNGITTTQSSRSSTSASASNASVNGISENVSDADARRQLAGETGRILHFLAGGAAGSAQPLPADCVADCSTVRAAALCDSATQTFENFQCDNSFLESGQRSGDDVELAASGMDNGEPDVFPAGDASAAVGDASGAAGDGVTRAPSADVFNGGAGHTGRNGETLSGASTGRRAAEAAPSVSSFSAASVLDAPFSINPTVMFGVQTAMLVGALATYSIVEVWQSSFMAQRVLPPLFVAATLVVFPVTDPQVRANFLTKPIFLLDASLIFAFTGFTLPVMFLLVALTLVTHLALPIALHRPVLVVFSQLVLTAAAFGVGAMMFARTCMAAVDLLYAELYPVVTVRRLPYVGALERQCVAAVRARLREAPWKPAATAPPPGTPSSARATGDEFSPSPAEFGSGSSKRRRRRRSRRDVFRMSTSADFGRSPRARRRSPRPVVRRATTSGASLLTDDGGEGEEGEEEEFEEEYDEDEAGGPRGGRGRSPRGSFATTSLPRRRARLARGLRPSRRRGRDESISILMTQFKSYRISSFTATGRGSSDDHRFAPRRSRRVVAAESSLLPSSYTRGSLAMGRFAAGGGGAGGGAGGFAGGGCHAATGSAAGGFAAAGCAASFAAGDSANFGPAGGVSAESATMIFPPPSPPRSPSPQRSRSPPPPHRMHRQGLRQSRSAPAARRATGGRVAGLRRGQPASQAPESSASRPPPRSLGGAGGRRRASSIFSDDESSLPNDGGEGFGGRGPAAAAYHRGPFGDAAGSAPAWGGAGLPLSGRSDPSGLSDCPPGEDASDCSAGGPLSLHDRRRVRFSTGAAAAAAAAGDDADDGGPVTGCATIEDVYSGYLAVETPGAPAAAAGPDPDFSHSWSDSDESNVVVIIDPGVSRSDERLDRQWSGGDGGKAAADGAAGGAAGGGVFLDRFAAPRGWADDAFAGERPAFSVAGRVRPSRAILGFDEGSGGGGGDLRPGQPGGPVDGPFSEAPDGRLDFTGGDRLRCTKSRPVERHASSGGGAAEDRGRDSISVMESLWSGHAGGEEDHLFYADGGAGATAAAAAAAAATDAVATQAAANAASDEILSHFYSLLLNQIRHDLRFYRRWGVLGIRERNSEWRSLLWAFLQSAEYMGSPTGAPEVYVRYGLRGWLPFQKAPGASGGTARDQRSENGGSGSVAGTASALGVGCPLTPATTVSPSPGLSVDGGASTPFDSGDGSRRPGRGHASGRASFATLRSSARTTRRRRMPRYSEQCSPGDTSPARSASRRFVRSGGGRISPRGLFPDSARSRGAVTGAHAYFSCLSTSKASSGSGGPIASSSQFNLTAAGGEGSRDTFAFAHQRRRLRRAVRRARHFFHRRYRRVAAAVTGWILLLAQLSGVDVLVHFFLSSKFVLDLAVWAAAPQMPRQHLFTLKFTNEMYEKWYLDWSRGTCAIISRILIVFQLIGTAINVGFMGVSVGWLLSLAAREMQALGRDFPAGAAACLYAILIPAFAVADLAMILPQLYLRRHVQKAHHINRLVLLSALNRAAASFVCCRFNLRYSTDDAVVYGQVVMNAMLMPLGVTLAPALPRLYFALLCLMTNGLMIMSQRLHPTGIGPLLLRFNLAMTHVALVIYLLYLRSQDDQMRRVFSLAALPYLIRITDTARVVALTPPHSLLATDEGSAQSTRDGASSGGSLANDFPGSDADSRTSDRSIFAPPKATPAPPDACPWCGAHMQAPAGESLRTDSPTAAQFAVAGAVGRSLAKPPRACCRAALLRRASLDDEGKKPSSLGPAPSTTTYSTTSSPKSSKSSASSALSWTVRGSSGSGGCGAGAPGASGKRGPSNRHPPSRVPSLTPRALAVLRQRSLELEPAKRPSGLALRLPSLEPLTPAGFSVRATPRRPPLSQQSGRQSRRLSVPESHRTLWPAQCCSPAGCEEMPLGADDSWESSSAGGDFSESSVGASSGVFAAGIAGFNTGRDASGNSARLCSAPAPAAGGGGGATVRPSISPEWGAGFKRTDCTGYFSPEETPAADDARSLDLDEAATGVAMDVWRRRRRSRRATVAGTLFSLNRTVPFTHAADPATGAGLVFPAQARPDPLPDRRARVRSPPANSRRPTPLPAEGARKPGSPRGQGRSRVLRILPNIFN